MASPRRWRWLSAVLWPVALAAAAAGMYAPGLRHAFVTDDKYVFLINPTFRQPSLAGLKGIWTTDYWQGIRPDGSRVEIANDRNLYRPVTMFTFWLNAAVGGASPWGYRLINILLHAGVAWMVGRWCAGWFGRPAGLAAAAILLFHPIATDPVNRIVGRADLLVALATAGFLVTQQAARRKGWGVWRTVWASMWMAAALGAKESGVILIPLAMAQAWLDRPGRSMAAIPGPRSCGPDPRVSPRRWWAGLVLALLLPAGLYAAGRIAAVSLPHYDAQFRGDILRSPAIGAGFAQRLPASLALGADYARMMLLPWPMRAFEDVPRLPGWSDASPWVGLAVLAGLALAAAASLRRRHLLALGLLWWWLHYLTVSQLAIPIGEYKAVRLAYPMLPGLALAIGWLVGRRAWQAKAWRAIAVGATGGACLAGLVLTLLRNPDWRNQITLLEADQRVDPRNAACLVRLADSYKVNGRVDDSRRLLERSAELAPHSPVVWSDLADLALGQRDLKAARRAYVRLARLDPTGVAAALGLGSVALLEGDMLSASQCFELARQRDPSNPVPWINLGMLAFRDGQEHAAEEMFQQALLLVPDHPLALQNLAALDAARGRLEQAVQRLEYLLRRHPGHRDAMEMLQNYRRRLAATSLPASPPQTNVRSP